MDDEFRNEDEERNETKNESYAMGDETKNETVGDETNNETYAMSDEEIRAAAENIGPSPYASYESSYGRSGSSAYTSYDYSASRDPYEIKQETKKKNVLAKIGKFVGLAACFGVIAGAAFFGATTLLDRVMGEKSFLNTAETVEQSTANALNQLGVSNLVIAASSTTKEQPVSGNAVVDVVKENMSSTVCVSMEYTISQVDRWTGRSSSYKATGGGSGFIVGMSDKEIFIATNNHVVENADTIKITFSDDEIVEATVRATDPDNDLAIVSVLKDNISAETLTEIKVATLGNSDEAQVGEMVVAIGNALGYGQSVTVGYLSAKDREVDYESMKLRLLQTDAAINEGNSGGPLFNTKGEVIGINCAKYANEKVEGMCFAIPISAAIPILDDLMNREIVAEEDQGYLGVTITDVSETYASLYGIPYGVNVRSVVEGGSAAKAGIYSGDVITHVNGIAVTTSDQLKNRVNSYKYGTTIQITVQRLIEGKWTEMVIDVELMKKPSDF